MEVTCSETERNWLHCTEADILGHFARLYSAITACSLTLNLTGLGLLVPQSETVPPCSTYNLYAACNELELTGAQKRLCTPPKGFWDPLWKKVCRCNSIAFQLAGGDADQREA